MNAYTRLAYEHAALIALSQVIQKRFLPIEGADGPEVTVTCGDLPRDIGEIPEEVWADIAARLGALANNRKSRMNNFRFVPMEDLDELEWERTKTTVGDSKNKSDEKKGKAEEVTSRSSGQPKSVQRNDRKPIPAVKRSGRVKP
jgi:hypothetical protein